MTVVYALKFSILCIILLAIPIIISRHFIEILNFISLGKIRKKEELRAYSYFIESLTKGASSIIQSNNKIKGYPLEIRNATFEQFLKIYRANPNVIRLYTSAFSNSGNLIVEMNKAEKFLYYYILVYKDQVLFFDYDNFVKFRNFYLNEGKYELQRTNVTNYINGVKKDIEKAKEEAESHFNQANKIMEEVRKKC